MKIVNPTGETVKGEFFGHGTFVIKPGEVKDIPGAAWDAWQDPALWNGGACRLQIYAPPKEGGGKGGKK
ncbi:MAG: hypothetical protein AB1327_08120 [Bacillota bacterium]